MIHIFKLNGHRIAYDCTRRVSFTLSALAMKIAEAVHPPLSEECPSSLRYAFAKYDSHDLSEAYQEVYALADRGLFDTAAGDAPAPADEDPSAADGACYVPVSPDLPLGEAVLQLAELGVRFIHAEIPAATNPKELIRLAKDLEKLRDDGKTIFFAPFVSALEVAADHAEIPDACRHCWAQEICLGRALHDGENAGTRCDLVRACIECGIVLYDEPKKIV